jgi:phosphate transport system protein
MAQPEDHELPGLTGQLAVVLRDVRMALSRATGVLFGAAEDAENDMAAAEQALHAARAESEELTPAGAVSSPSEAPSIGATVAVVHLGGDIERLAELTQQIAEIAWSRRSKEPLPGQLGSVTREMSDNALSLVARAGEAVEKRPAVAVRIATGLETQLADIAGRQRFLDRLLVSCDPPVGTADAVDVALLGRCYEGCARHAVSAVRHVAMLAS